MPQEHITVGIVVERRKLDSPWADHVWVPVAVLPDAPDAAPWTPLGGEADAMRFYLGPATLTLYAVDTAHIRDGLELDRPSIWVSIRPTGEEPPVMLVGATADPAEGEGFANAIGDVIEALPMPPEIAARAAAFVAEHHVEREFIKRKRDRPRGEEGDRGRARPLVDAPHHSRTGRDGDRS